jgi:hypothetical protein
MHLKAIVSFVGTDLETVQSRHTELWASKSDWREETATGDSIHLEIGGAGKPWILDKTKYPPEKPKPAAAVMQMFPASSAKLDFESVADHEDLDLSTVCAARLLRPGRNSYDESAISAVRDWRFKPAALNGDPIQVQINIEVGFNVRR